KIRGGGCIGFIGGAPVRLDHPDGLKSFLFGAVENLQRGVRANRADGYFFRVVGIQYCFHFFVHHVTTSLSLPSFTASRISITTKSSGSLIWRPSYFDFSNFWNFNERFRISGEVGPMAGSPGIRGETSKMTNSSFR